MGAAGIPAAPIVRQASIQSPFPRHGEHAVRIVKIWAVNESPGQRRSDSALLTQGQDVHALQRCGRNGANRPGT